MFQWLSVVFVRGLFGRGLFGRGLFGRALFGRALFRGALFSRRIFGQGLFRQGRVFGLAVILLGAGLLSNAAAAGGPAPEWDKSSSSSTDDGYFELIWDGKAKDPEVFYKVTEAFSGNEVAEIEANTAEYFVEGDRLPARRVVAGEYLFSLQSCVKDEDGFPECGKSSKELSLTVTDKVVDSMIDSLIDGAAQPLEGTSDALTATTFDGGPDEFRPGNWYNPAKAGHGWTFFWSNRLALPENDSLYGNSYDLVGVWYTYEAKRASTSPSHYRPLALRLKAMRTSTNSYRGTVYMTQANGSSISVGYAEVKFGVDSLNAQVSWVVNFKKEYLSDIDNIELLHGTDPARTTGVSHLSGIWEPATGNQFYVVTDIGSTAEVDALVLHDSLGDPTWVQAVNYGTPVSGSTMLCFGYLKDGYSPKKNKPSSWTPAWHTSGCNNATTASGSNRNSRRYFSSPNSSDATQRFWASFVLPGTTYATGSLSAGSYSSPVVLQKKANFHGVKYQYPSGSSCDLAGSSGQCRVSLSWFTDGYYPYATVFARNKTSGTSIKVRTSTTTAMLNVAYDIVSTGKYEFDLRMGTTTSSALMASSEVFTVTDTTAPPPSGNPDGVPTPVGQPSLSASSASSRVGATRGQFKVDATGAATYSIPIMNAPVSGGLQPNVSLDYSSLAGNGTMGVGWSLGGVSAITRCAQTIEQDGISGSRAIKITNEDRFCLGGQRLMLVSGTYGSYGSQYRTELDGFSRITLYSSGQGSTIWFKVEHKNGSVSEYGRASTSRIEARGSANPGAFLVWMQNRYEDRFGNYMLFTYQENTSGAVGYVLTKIDYSGNRRAGTPPSARLIFGYSNRSAANDLSYSYLGGVQMEQRKLLRYVRVQGKINSGNAYQDMRFYDLNYGLDGLGRHALSSLRECSSSSKAVCFPSTKFDWLKTENGISGSGSFLSGLLPKTNVRGMVLADVNGDGRPDLLYTQKVNAKMLMRVREARANGTFSLWPKSYEITRREDGQVAPLMVLDADGDGLQDVIYSKYNASSHDYGWVALISTGSDFTSERKLHSSYRYFLNDEGMAPIAQVLDFNGDGLGDVLFSRTNSAGTTSQLSVMLNQSRLASNFGFSSPVNLNTDNADLFVIGNGGGFEMRVRPPYYTTANTDGHDHKTPSAKVFDYNNDGTADLLLKVYREFEKCVENCQNYSSPPAPGAGSSGVTPVLEVDTASFWVVMTSNGSNAYTRHSILALGDDCDMDLICNKSQYQNLPKVKVMNPVDINADGLADLVYREAGDYWRFQLNTGSGFTAPGLIARAPYDVGDLVRFEDWNGDGYPDLLYPSTMLNANAKWMVHLNHFGREFASAENTGAYSGNVGGRPLVDKVENDSSLFADFTGDGKLDQLRIDRNNLGENISSRLTKGRNLLAGSAVAPANVITKITDGYGAIHSITYKPMTDPTVYSRMRDSGNANWGRGSVVYDLAAPIFLVSQASISAPRSFVPGATSSISYHFVGAKMQAGGRGFLGFGEIISYDNQSKIRSNTRFRQDFPYIGMVADKLEATNATNYKFRTLSNQNTNTPRNWGSVGYSTAAASSPGGTPISYFINEWTKRTTTSSGTVFPYVADALERNYTLNGSFSSKGFTTTSYDSYGNVMSLKSSIYAANSGGAYTTQTTSNTYYAANISSWDFARVKTSNVTKTRSGATAVTRKTAFEYDSVTAAVRKETKEPGHSKLEVITSFTLDKFGNQLSSSVTGRNMSSRTSSAVYDPLGRFSIQSKNALGQVTQTITSWDRFGNALKAKNINGVEAVAGADHMGRLFITYTPTGDWSKTLQLWRGNLTTGDAGYCPAGTVYYAKTTGGGKPAQIKCFDLLQRETRTAKQTISGRYSFVDQNYDSSGRIAAVSEPYFSGSPFWSNTDYDVLGRIAGIMSAAGDDVLHAYDNAAGNSCTGGGAHRLRVTNGLGRQQVQVKNVLDESIAVYDAYCGKISYAYDAQGNLTRITGADGQRTTMTYDLAGRKVAMNDPDKGIWQYAYNALGEMTRQLDPKGQAIDFVYDKLGRLTQRYERTGVSSLTDASYTTVNSEISSYFTSGQGKGQVSSVNYRNASGGQLHKKSFTYDSFGRPTIVSTSVAGNVFAEETTYDQYGRVYQQFDASGDDHGLRYLYSYGHISKIREAREGSAGTVYQRVLAMDARGNVTNMELGNGTDVIADYDARSGRLLGLSAYNAQGAEIQNVDYLFDVLGNLKRRSDYSGSANLKEQFTYDSLDRLRLVKLSTNNSAYANTLDTRYNAAGNITYKSDIGSYLYQASQPHAVSKAGNASYLYDANGNQTRGDGRAIGYTVFDKPGLIIKSGKKVKFEYGVGNNRYQRKDYNGSTLEKTTLYLGSVERITKSGSTLFKRYLAGVAIADYYPSTGAQSVSYLIKDHIGSIHTVLNEYGQISATMHFSAFGERQNTNWKTPLTSYLYAPLNDITTKGFTGHEQIDDMGMIHMNGRTYDPKLGRFLQADPIVQAPKYSQSLNRYSYVMNNPLSSTDPTGLFDLNRFIKTWGKVIVIAVISYYTFGAASGAASGWLSGGVGSGWSATTVATVSGVIGGATAGLVAGAMATGTLKGALKGALVGAAIGGIAGGSNPYGNNAGDAIIRGALTNVTTDNKYVSALSYLYVGANGSIKALADLVSSTANMSKFALNYGFSKVVEKFANRHNMELWEFNLALTINSFIGIKVAGSTISNDFPSEVQIEGFFSRGKHRWLGVIWDVNDTILGYQGLLDAVGYEYVNNYRGKNISVSHSLGALRASNLVASGYAPSANVFSLPFLNVAPSNINVTLGKWDFVNGWFLGGLLNPGATMTPCLDSSASGSFCHKYTQNYLKSE